MEKKSKGKRNRSPLNSPPVKRQKSISKDSPKKSEESFVEDHRLHKIDQQIRDLQDANIFREDMNKLDNWNFQNRCKLFLSSHFTMLRALYDDHPNLCSDYEVTTHLQFKPTFKGTF